MALVWACFRGVRNGRGGRALHSCVRRQVRNTKVLLSPPPRDTTLANKMLENVTSDPHDIEIANIHVVAGVLRRMLSELQDLEVGNARLHFAMSDARHDLRQRLDMLSGTAELLRESHPAVRDGELRQRARRLIFQLTGELEQLALKAEHEFEWIGQAGTTFHDVT